MRIVIAILFVVFSSYTFASESTIRDRIDEINLELLVLQGVSQDMLQAQMRSPTVIRPDLLERYDELFDLYHELALERGNIVSLDANKAPVGVLYQGGDGLYRAGNFVVTKPKPADKRWWTDFALGYQHAALIYSENEIIEAVGSGKKSRKISLSTRLQQMFDTSEYVFIIDTNLNLAQRLEMQAFADVNLVDKPYPSAAMLPLSKYSMSTFYCSSLVWRAHKNAGHKIDLDDYPDLVVLPIELLNNADYRGYNIYTLYGLNSL